MKRALILSGGGARGAFQVGVMKYLKEINWTPDLICGTSVGALNATAYGSGMSIDQMTRLWRTYRRKQIFRITLAILFRSFTRRQKFSPMSDTRPLEKMFETELDIAALRKSPAKIIISTLNMITGQVVYFNQQAIQIRHIMAASAIPGLFGWQYIDGIPYWDAGVMVNTPITPALKLGAKEIIVVLHSPVGAFQTREPRSPLDVAELVFEQFLIGSYTNVLPDASWSFDPDAQCHRTPLPGSPQLQLAAKDTRIMPVAPKKMLGLPSLLNFSLRQAEALIKEGYNCAQMQLKGLG